MRNAWIRYRIMAWLVGTLLVVLVCVGLPLKYLGGDETVVLWTAIPHGWLYMVLLIGACAGLVASLAMQRECSIGEICDELFAQTLGEQL